MGEHDYYLDLGEYWSKLYGPQWYSFDHKGVHFVVLNSILTTDEWTFHRWPTAEQRMLEMAGLDNPNGSPFMVGEKQRAWLKDDLDKVAKDTPLIVFSHSPLQKIYKGWNFWTDDAEQVQALVAAVQDRQCDLRPRAPDPVQSDRQHLLQCGDGDGLALALPRHLCASRRACAGADGSDEPRRPVLRTRRHRLADDRRQLRPRHRALSAVGQWRARRRLRSEAWEARRQEISRGDRPQGAAAALLRGE